MSIAVSFLVGIAVGAILGFLLTPTAHYWVGRREWREASRELELADRLLESLSDADEPPTSGDDGSSERLPPRVVRHDFGR